MTNELVVIGESSALIERLSGKRPLFVLTIGTTDTAKIPGISAAGRSPELCDFTPAADAEYIVLERCLSIDGVPVTPDGIPTPALITRAAVKLARIPVLVVNAGARFRPKLPHVELGGGPGGDIRTGRAVAGARELFEAGKLIGEQTSAIADYLVLAESVPGGTTTALGVLMAMGFDAEGRVSSSMSYNPHELKVAVVEEGMRRAGISRGSLRADPLKAVEVLGDPTIPVIAGILTSSCRNVPVLLAGGTQMTAVLAVAGDHIRPHVENVAIATTRWIVEDRGSDIFGLLRQVMPEVPLVYPRLSFKGARYEGLRAYEDGVVKEGVGAGGAVVSCLLRSSSLSLSDVVTEVERQYERLTEAVGHERASL